MRRRIAAWWPEINLADEEELVKEEQQPEIGQMPVLYLNEEPQP